uniref:LSM domain-containing protein n=1 Tax=Castor canadensis TaxID=51338 RepID=A0A8C0WQJ0_CASCN
MGYRTPLKLCAKLCGCFYVLLLPHRPNPQLTLNFKNSVTQKAAKNHFLLSGYLVFGDGCVNMQLANTEEHVDGHVWASGEVFRRYYNVLCIRGVEKEEDGERRE